MRQIHRRFTPRAMIISAYSVLSPCSVEDATFVGLAMAHCSLVAAKTVRTLAAAARYADGRIGGQNHALPPTRYDMIRALPSVLPKVTNGCFTACAVRLTFGCLRVLEILNRLNLLRRTPSCDSESSHRPSPLCHRTTSFMYYNMDSSDGTAASWAEFELANSNPSQGDSEQNHTQRSPESSMSASLVGFWRQGILHRIPGTSTTRPS